MGFLFASDKKKPIPEFTGLQVQTSVNTLPIAIVYGGPRIQMNLIYTNGFRAEEQQTGGGKGLLSGGKGGTSGYKYFATFMGALCEGTISALRAVFDNQSVYSPSNAPEGKIFEVFTGTSTQNPWSVVQTNWPDDAFAYRDTAYIGFEDWPLDSSATIPQLNFLVDGIFFGTCPLNKYAAPDGTEWLPDADPALCINDFLTNSRYGAQFPSAFIDSTTLFTSADGFIAGVGDAALSTYCQAVGFGWSAVINNFEPASSILERWCRNLVVAPVWTGTLLKFIPYLETYADGNPGYDAGLATVAKKYFRPNTTPLFDLGDADFIESEGEEDPIELMRVDVWADVKNVWRVDFHDRNLMFNSTPAEAKDEAFLEMFGTRAENVVSGDEFTFQGYAKTSAQLQLNRNVSVLNSFKFRLGWQWCLLEPMDIVTITDATLGLNKQPVRIRSIEEDEKGILTVTAEEFRSAQTTPTFYPSDTSEPPTFLNTIVDPGDVNPPIIIEPTPSLLATMGRSGPHIMIGLSGGSGGVANPNWGGANVYFSNDDVTYQFQGNTNKSRTGSLTAALPAYSGANPDNTNQLKVDLRESASTLESATADQAAMGLTVCAVVDANGDFEFVGYTTATLTGTNQFTLTGLYRGLYGTVACAHLSGGRFLRLDSLPFLLPWPAEFVGTQIYGKFPSFNIWGQAPQLLSSVSAYTYTPQGFGIDYSANPIVQAMLLGQDVDFEAMISGELDLDAGGTGACDPISFTIDLGTT